MRVGLVFAPYYHKKFEEDVEIVSREFGTFPPLGLGFAAAIAERAGHETLLIDAHAERLSPPEVLERLRPFDPQLLGFMLTTYMFHDTLAYIDYLKRETQLPTVVGNIQMELYPAETLSYPSIDFGIMGSAQQAFPALLAALAAGRPAPDVPGICYKRDGQVIVNRPQDFAEPFATLPFPKRAGLPHHLYHAVMTRRHNVTAMITSKGCPYQCSFCHIHRTPYSNREPAGVVAEIEECTNDHGIREFEIFDPTFTVDARRVTAICRGIIDRGLDVDYAVRTRVDRVDPELLRLMAASGCKRILYGIETGSQALLDRVSKDTSLDQVRRAVGWTRDAGIAAVGFFLVGMPGETEADIEQTRRFSRELNLEYAQFHRTMAKPCTALHRQVTAHLGYDYWREFTLNHQPEMRLPSPWSAFTQEEIEQAVFRSYRYFYLRPKFVAKTLYSIRSLGQLSRYARSGIG